MWWRGFSGWGATCAPPGPRPPGGGGRLLGGRARRADGADDPDPVEQAPAPFADPVEGLDAERRMSRVWALVDELSPQQRAAVTLSCREGLATKEIAAVLSLSEATVRVHLHRALATLRRRLGDEA